MTDPSMDELRTRYSERFNASATLKFFGFKMSFADSQTVLIEIDPVLDAHRGGLGTQAINGGVIAAMFDLAIGCTAALVDPRRKSATVQLSISFMRATKGNAVSAKARVNRHGGSLIFSTASVFDEAGVECARCDGIVRISEEHWPDGTSPAVN